MWNFINRYNANILSAYSNNDGNSRPGKKAWLSKNAKPTGKIHLVQRADKKKYATSNGKPNILIDDYIKNIKEWESAGGIGIHHTSPNKLCDGQDVVVVSVPRAVFSNVGRAQGAPLHAYQRNSCSHNRARSKGFEPTVPRTASRILVAD